MKQYLGQCYVRLECFLVVKWIKVIVNGVTVVLAAGKADGSDQQVMDFSMSTYSTLRNIVLSTKQISTMVRQSEAQQGYGQH